MLTRKIIKIDQTLCNGCGKCIPNCAEGAMQIVNGKAKIIKDSYCDGLGACLGHCPQGALEIIEREAENFDKKAVEFHLNKTRKKVQKTHKVKTQWPIQLNLVSTTADFFKDSDILLAADCVPATYPDFHSKLILEKILLIGCPKFDDAIKYAAKLGEILINNNVKSITVAHMEVPCCSGLKWIAQKAVESSNKSIPIKNMLMGINGEIK